MVVFRAVGCLGKSDAVPRHVGPEVERPVPIAAADWGVDREPALSVGLDLRQILDFGIEAHERREPDRRPLDRFPCRIDDRARHRERWRRGGCGQHEPGPERQRRHRRPPPIRRKSREARH